MTDIDREATLTVLPRYIKEYRRRYLSLGWSGNARPDFVDRYKALMFRLWREARRELAKARKGEA